MADNRPIVYEDHGTWVYRASSAGRPLRCLAAARAGFQALHAPAYLTQAAEAGNRYEVIVKDRLTDMGFVIDDEQPLVELEVQSKDPRIIVRGHLDGWPVVAPLDKVEWATGLPDDASSEGLVLEVKSMSDRQYRKWLDGRFDRFATYAFQMSAYMLATDALGGVYAVINRDTDELEVSYLTRSPIGLQKVREHVLLAHWWGGSGQLPPCDSSDGYWCAYDYLCDRREMMFDEVESGSVEILVRLAEDYDKARAMEAEVKAQKDMARDEILEAMGDRSKVQVGPWSINVITAERSSLDQKKLASYLAAQGKTLDEFKKKSSYTQVRVEGST